MNNDERLFTLLIYLAIGVIGWVIVVGGVIAIREETYTFNSYLRDIAVVVPYLFGAIAAVLLRALVRQRNGKEKP